MEGTYKAEHLSVYDPDICPISSIRSSLKLDKTQMSISRKMDELTVVHLYKGVRFSKRKESTLDTCHMDGLHRNRIKS